MSNPTTHVESFGGSLGAFTGIEPIRYSNGLWLEEASANYVTNPIGTVNTTGWADPSTTTVTRETVLPGPLPGWLASLVTTGFKVTADSTTSAGLLVVNTALPAAAGTYRLPMQVWVPSSFTGSGLAVRGANFTGNTSSTDGVVNLSLRDQWQEVVAIIAPAAGDLVGSVGVYLTSGTMQAGEYIVLTCSGMQPGSYNTSIVVGSFGAGYAFTGTAHASSSTRAASSAAISPSGILSPSSGALAFRITPTIETGVEEIWGEVGAKGSGADHVRWGRDSSKHPFVEWSSNDAAYQRLTGSETLNALTAYDLYLGHDGTVTSLAVDAGTLQTGTRAAVSGDFSTGDLTLEASAGGVIYQPFATFNRPLTAKEIATLNGKNNWTMNVLTGNPYINFQLRPY